MLFRHTISAGQPASKRTHYNRIRRNTLAGLACSLPVLSASLAPSAGHAIDLKSIGAEASIYDAATQSPLLDLDQLANKPKVLDLTTYHIEIEAEDLALTNYQRADNTTASSGQLISLIGSPSGTEGSASIKFDGATAQYYLVLYYLDENDGESTLSVEVGGVEIDTWTLSEDQGTAGADAAAFTARRIGPVRVERDATIGITGVRNADEGVRVDMLQLIPIDDLYEAEDAALAGGAAVRSVEPGFTGDAYVRMGNEIGPIGGLTLASAVQPIQSVTSKLATPAKAPITQASFPGITPSDLVYTLGQKSIEWDVPSADGGDYAIEVRYAHGSAEDTTRPLDVFVNDALVIEELPFDGTVLAHRWRSQILIASLQPGANKIRLETTGSGGPSIDYLLATPVNYLNARGDVSPLSSPYAPEYGDSDYLDSYYGRVDPNGERTTLDDWLEINGFNDPGAPERSAEYINANDLGFGREMHCLDTVTTPCYVRNFLDPEGASFFAATVTMERLTNGIGGSFIAFFVYDGDGNRINQIALDSEGPKAVPESCWACHGGGEDDAGEYVGGTYLPFDIDALKDWTAHATRAEQLGAFRLLNEAMLDDATAHHGADSNPADLIKGWYGGDPGSLVKITFGNFLVNALPNYDADRLPRSGWHDGENVLGADADGDDELATQRFLYQDVYGTYCRLCHVAQDIDWHDATAGDFMMAAYNHVCRPENNSPRMPHAEVTFDKFNFEKRYTLDDVELPPALPISNLGKTLSPDHRLTGTGSLSKDPYPAGPIDFGDFAVVPDRESAKEMLCETLGLVVPNGEQSSGEQLVTERGCTGCHGIGSAGPVGPDLQCRASWLRQDMSTISSQMAGVSLTLQEMADLRAYLNGFDNCN